MTVSTNTSQSANAISFEQLPPIMQGKIKSASSSPDMTSAVALATINSYANNLEEWQKVASALNLTPEMNVTTAGERLKLYQSSVDTYYYDLNDFFIFSLKKLRDNSEAATSSEEVEKLEKQLPTMESGEFLNNIKYHSKLRGLIQSHPKDPVLFEMLFQSVGNRSFPVFKMLIEAGIKPASIEESVSTEDKPEMIESLQWAGVLTTNPDNFSNPDFFKVVLDNNELSPKLLTYLLLLMCQNETVKDEDKEIEVMKLLLSKGAKWDSSLTTEFFEIAGMKDDMPSFDYRHAHKPKVKAFVEASKEAENSSTETAPAPGNES